MEKGASRSHPSPPCEQAYARMGGMGQVHFGSASGISARASGLRMSAAVLLQYKTSVAEATPRKNYWKRGGGLCEGGLRRHEQRRQRHTQTTIRNKALNTLKYHCEEEPDAGGRIPFSPQTDACPSQRARRRYWRGNAGYLGI